MTEADWWAATDPDKLIDWLFFDARATDRKLRLFAVACCRRIEYVVAGTPFTELLRLIEAFADGQASEEQIDRADEACRPPVDPRRGTPTVIEAKQAILSAANDLEADRWRLHRSREWYEDEDNLPYPLWVTSDVRLEVESQTGDYSGQARAREASHQVLLLHDIFGPLPFRDVPIHPDWLTSTVVALARGIYDEKAFDRMPILADALQDAGCDNDEILSHCRREGWEHVRGCWVIDLLLGRPWREGA